jgi:hypothetical protein
MKSRSDLWASSLRLTIWPWKSLNTSFCFTWISIWIKPFIRIVFFNELWMEYPEFNINLWNDWEYFRTRGGFANPIIGRSAELYSLSPYPPHYFEAKDARKLNCEYPGQRSGSRNTIKQKAMEIKGEMFCVCRSSSVTKTTIFMPAAWQGLRMSWWISST